MSSSESLISFLLPAHPPSFLHLKILLFAVYLALMRLIMLLPDKLPRKILFVIFNLGAVALLYKIKFLPITSLGTYFVAIVACYILLRFVINSRFWAISAWAPIFLLLVARYSPANFVASGMEWLGLSYMSFRLSQLAVIVRNAVVPVPGILDYLGFSFFAPTILIGPISAYSTFYASFGGSQRQLTPSGRCALRILIGGAKLLVLAAVFDRLSYRGLMLDGHFHPPVDLLIAAVAYYLYIYFNFSGFCDIAIGAAGLMGIKVSENFDFPFAARNMKEFWNRWHMTLSGFMRDMVFAPVSKTLMQKLPAGASEHGIALAIALVFILIGVWHGREWHYLLWGAMNAVGVVANYYYGNFLKRRLSKEQIMQYNRDRYIHFASVAATFIFVCLTLFVFANSFDDMHRIFAAIR
jgi:D-alanyl-lipoteichoic acid acyltransferase DltB (MBOAT superfamily)